MATAISGLPSPVRSPIAIPRGVEAVVLSNLAAKDDALITPGVDVFRKIEIDVLVVFPATMSALPSPSKSPDAQDCVSEPSPVVKVWRASKKVDEICPVYVSLKGFVLLHINPVSVFKTVMFSWVAPTGTITVKLVEVALFTTALAIPKKTILLADVVLKPDPEIVTTVPTGPLAGVKLVIIGCPIELKKVVNRTSIKPIFFIIKIISLRSS